MGDISENISRHEVRCKCGKCSFDTIDAVLVRELQSIVEFFSKKLNKEIFLSLTSVCRCPWWNGKCGGEHDSGHLEGKCADFWLGFTNGRVDAEEIYAYLDEKYKDMYDIGLYTGGLLERIHFGIHRYRRFHKKESLSTS